MRGLSRIYGIYSITSSKRSRKIKMTRKSRTFLPNVQISGRKKLKLKSQASYRHVQISHHVKFQGNWTICLEEKREHTHSDTQTQILYKTSREYPYSRLQKKEWGPDKKRYVIFEWPLGSFFHFHINSLINTSSTH